MGLSEHESLHENNLIRASLNIEHLSYFVYFNQPRYRSSQHNFHSSDTLWKFLALDYCFKAPVKINMVKDLFPRTRNEPTAQRRKTRAGTTTDRRIIISDISILLVATLNRTNPLHSAVKTITCAVAATSPILTTLIYYNNTNCTAPSSRFLLHRAAVATTIQVATTALFSPRRSLQKWNGLACFIRPMWIYLESIACGQYRSSRVQRFPKSVRQPWIPVGNHGSGNQKHNSPILTLKKTF